MKQPTGWKESTKDIDWFGQPTMIKSDVKSARVAAVCATWIALSTGSAYSQADLEQPSPEKTAPKQSTPTLAHDLSREAITQLIDNIEAPHAASSLKLAYFARREQAELPLDDGVALLKQAISKETIGSERWFILNNVLASAIFSTGTLTTEDGFATYDALFDAAPQASSPKATYFELLSLEEFSGLVASRFKDLGLQREPQTKKTLLKAWGAYLKTSTHKSAGVVPAPDFGTAFVRTDSQADVIPLITQNLADPTVPHTYFLLTTAAQVLAKSQPDKAIAYLQEAKPLLPKDKGGNLDINEAGRFYNLLADLQEKQGHVPEAIATQREHIRATGVGLSKLLLMLKANKDDAGYQETLSQLLKADAPEREILAAATGLYVLSRKSQSPDDKADRDATTLLESYLQAGRPRVNEYELEARLQLGLAFIRHQDQVKAKEVLTVSQAQLPTSSQGRSILRQIDRALKSIEVPTPDAATQ